MTVDVGVKPPAPERYIGDGVYARHDGYQFWLRTDRDGMRHEIALDPGTFNALVEMGHELERR